VIFRFAEMQGSEAPLPIDLNEAETTAIAVLADSNLVEDAAWTKYVKELAELTEAAGLGKRMFPIAMEKNVLGALGLEEQALRWDQWQGSEEELRRRLTNELTYELCRVLRHHLERLKHPAEDDAALEAYVKKVQIFLSHSKHDDDGVRIALAIRERLNGGHGLSSFFDVHDIPAGLRFHRVLLNAVRVSAMVAIHTNSYSSREWCRREVIEAKRWNVPLVIANSISDKDERGFPYMGNVPVIRLEPSSMDRIDVVVGLLLDEVLKDFLWRCRVEIVRDTKDATTFFLPRPPELISLAILPPISEVSDPIIVYPDPPLSAEEERLFAQIAPRVQLRSFTEWIAGAVR